MRRKIGRFFEVERLRLEACVCLTAQNRVFFELLTIINQIPCNKKIIVQSVCSLSHKERRNRIGEGCDVEYFIISSLSANILSFFRSDCCSKLKHCDFSVLYMSDVCTEDLRDKRGEKAINKKSHHTSH